MTREEFIEILDVEGYPYKMEGDKIIVTYKGYVALLSLTSLPPGVVFKNEGDVILNALTSLPPGVGFNNGGDVYLGYLMGRIDEWQGNIKGINSRRLLNFMIKQGLFER